MTSSTERQRLRPWLEDKINSGKVPGLCWRNKEKKEFRVSWKHAGKPDFVVEKDAMLFKLWAEHTGKYRPGESADPSTWKTRFRCALHKMPDVEEVKVPHSLDEKEPYRVFRFKDKDDCSQKPQNFGSLRSEENQNGKRPMCRVKGDSVIRSTAPSAKAENVFFNNYPILSGPLNCGRFQDSPHSSSDSSPEDDLDSITPTIPPYPSQGYEPMLTDEPICGNLPNPYQFSYTNSHLLFGGDSASDNFIRPTQLPPRLESLDFTNVRKDILEATLVANGQMFNGLSESGQAFLQHLMATNPALMKLWRQGAFSPNESSNGSSSVSTHFNMDNGLIEATGLEMDESMGRTVTNIHQSNENPGSGFARPGKQAGDSCESAMRIRVFYGNYEVLSTDTKQTESERLIRISHGCHMVEPRKLELGLLCQLFGPPTARQIELPPAVNNNSREVMKVMDFIKRGIILEINESNDIIVTRLCLARVYYSNGRKAAKKLIREERTKVFDYQGKFLPNLRESQNGNCEYPSYEVTLYLGRADGSLVSIVITHVMAKMTLHITSSSGENFWSEPNANDQLATNLEEDCMY